MSEHLNLSDGLSRHINTTRKEIWTCHISDDSLATSVAIRIEGPSAFALAGHRLT